MNKSTDPVVRKNRTTQIEQICQCAFCQGLLSPGVQPGKDCKRMYPTPKAQGWEVLLEQAYECGKLGHEIDHLRVLKHRNSLVISQQIAKAYSKGRREAAGEICDWTNDIEVKHYSGAGMEVWKLFKHIRNGIRDKYLI